MMTNPSIIHLDIQIAYYKELLDKSTDFYYSESLYNDVVLRDIQLYNDFIRTLESIKLTIKNNEVL